MQHSESGTSLSRQGARSSGKRKSLRDTAYEEIKRRIVSCELKPGEAVTVTELADALALGRTPVIQAIDRLTVDGLMKVMPRKGVVINPVSLDDFIEIIEMRLVNESQVVRWAAEKASRSEIAEMQANIDATWRAANARDIDGVITLDRAFHRAITATAGNSIMSEFLSNLHDKALRFWFISLHAPEHNIKVCEQHALILEGIKSHDPDATEKAMREHIASFHANTTSQILRV